MQQLWRGLLVRELGRLQVRVELPVHKLPEEISTSHILCIDIKSSKHDVSTGRTRHHTLIKFTTWRMNRQWKQPAGVGVIMYMCTEKA